MTSQIVSTISSIGQPLASAADDDLDVLSALLARCLPAARARMVAAELMADYGGLASVAAADEAALRRSGLEAAAIVDLANTRALALAMLRTEACRRPVLSSWTSLTAYLRAALAHLPREEFRVLYVDTRNILMRVEHRAEGTADHAPVYNAGPARVERLGRVPDIAETRNYVATVVDCYLALTAGRRLTSSRQCASEGASR